MKQTEVKNKIHALLAQQKEEIRLEVEKRKDGLFSLRGIEFLKNLPLEDPDKMVMDDLIQGYLEVQAHLKRSNGLARMLYGEIEEAARIDTVPGFGMTLSVLVAVEIADVNRFPTLPSPSFEEGQGI